MSTYFVLLTTIGKAKLANAMANGQPLELTEMRLGQGDYTPSQGQTSLIAQVWAGPLSSVQQDPENPGWVVAELILPPEVGGFLIREVGVFDNEGDLIFIGKFPETYKPLLEEGSGKDLVIRVILEVGNASSVTLTIDPSVVLASQQYVDERGAIYRDAAKMHADQILAEHLGKRHRPLLLVQGNRTAVAGDRFWVDTRQGGIVVTLPEQAGANDTVTLGDYAGTWGESAVTVVRNGHRINGAEEDLTLSSSGAVVTLEYVNAAQGWKIASGTAHGGGELVRRPVNVSPANGALGVSPLPTLEAGDFYSTWGGVAHAASRFQIATDAGFANIVYDSGVLGAVTSHVVTDQLDPMEHFWRAQYESALGEASEWSVPTSFVAAAVAVAAPQITSPQNDATDIPEQPVLETSAFSVLGDEDTHASTSWRIQQGGVTVWEELEDASNLLSIVVPAEILQEGTVYTVQARHHGQTYGASPWSSPATFTTSAQFIPADEIGVPYGGGYTAGKIVSDVDGETYLIIVSDGGGDSYQMGAGAKQWHTSNTSVTTTPGVPPMTLADGAANHAAMRAAGIANFPAAKWIDDVCNAGAGLNGKSDWYLPARDELELLYRNDKPTTDANNTGTRTTSGFGGDGAVHGTNNSSVPTGAGYTAGSPAQTQIVSFRTGQPDALTNDYYWSSTEIVASFAWRQLFNTGYQYSSLKTHDFYVRAVRRIKL